MPLLFETEKWSVVVMVRASRYEIMQWEEALEKLRRDDRLAQHYYERPLGAVSFPLHYSAEHFHKYLFDPRNPFCRTVQAFLTNDPDFARSELIPKGWRMTTLKELQREGIISKAPIPMLDVRQVNEKLNGWPLYDHKPRLILDDDGEP